MKLKCCDCGTLIEVPNDARPNEVISCSACGTDYVYNGSEWIESEYISEDWGE